MNKTSELEYLLLTHDPHITVITETWLNDGIPDEVIVDDAHHIFRRDRISRGGGIAVILKNTLSATLLPQIDNHESLFLKINCWGHALTLGAVYRPPSSPPEFLLALSHYMSAHLNGSLIMAGDFNLPTLDWSSNMTSHLLDSTLQDIMLTNDLAQVVHETTRESEGGGTTLDLVFVSRSITDYAVRVEDGISDHKLVHFSCTLGNCVKNRPKSKTVKNFSQSNDNAILDELWWFVDNMQNDDAIDLWNKFKATIQTCIENFVPSRHIKTNRQNPWVDRNIIHLKRRIKRAKKKKVTNVESLRHLREELQSALSCAKNKYFEITLPNFIKTNPQRFWRFLSSKSKQIDKIKNADVLITQPRGVADVLNEYFHSVFSPPDSDIPSFGDSLFDHNFISVEGVFSLLLNLKEKSSGGPDNIPNAFLRRYAEPVSHILAAIFRSCLKMAIIPDDWRIARVVAVHKKGDRLQKENYRPISLTSSCCKILEHIIVHFIADFLERNNLLSDYQHGFRKALSTTTQLTTTIHEIASTLDASGQVDLVFLDFSKAFDRVSHCKLLKKLQRFGLPSFIINWIKQYLSNRTQFVDVNGHFSGRLPVTSGVPQGSVLGPILFLMYVNDITAAVCPDVEIRLFADDCLIFKKVTCESDQISLNSSLAKIHEWCTTWSMSLNSEKTVLLRVTNKKQPFPFTYKINNNIVTEATEYKYLGVTITNKLTWSSHIENICSAATRKLGLLRHKLRNAPSNAKLLAYRSFVLPKIEYASVVWDPYYQKDKHRLEMVQRRAVRFIFNKYKRTDSPSSLMLENKIPSLEQRRKIARLKFLFLLYQNKLNVNARAYIQPFLSRTSRNRHAHNILPYQTRTNLFKYSFFPRTIVDWNSLSEKIVSSESVSVFESALLTDLETQ